MNLFMRWGWKGATLIGAIWFGALSFATFISRAAGLTVGLSKLPLAVPIWKQAALAFLFSPILQALTAIVFSVTFVALIYVPKLIQLNRIRHTDTLHRWSVNVDIAPNNVGWTGAKGGCLLFDVVLTNVSAQFNRVLEFRWITPGEKEDETIILSTENSRSQPYRTALQKIESISDRSLVPLKNPICVPSNGHVEGRIEIDVPPHIAMAWSDFEKQTAAMWAGHFEVFDRTSDQTISLKRSEGWDAINNEPRPVRRIIKYDIQL